ncbi:MAG: DNA polymerase I [Muribaculaceae bacterium]|nr:DNA polymerase I [Roseburia sp.]MCM1432108.1 DNA polymerase I [Muribaculaceae bacterium]MCM1493975.1 DNA polymerase I [Muribaculaceae bacterium]
MSKKLVLIDGHSILNRAFFGLPDLTNSEGLHTNAVYGFLNILFKILEEEKPDYLTVAFDVHAPTFRHRLYGDYKGTRGPMDDALKQQVPLIKEMLTAMGVRTVEMEGYEADDVLGTLAGMGEKEGMEVSVVSGDRDLLQLATEHVKIRIPKTKKTGTEIEDYYAADVKERYQVTPGEFIDVKALMGDTADNIPGVPGIGEKTATALISQYGSIEEVHAKAAEVKPPRASKNIVEFWEQAVMSKELATIITQVPLQYDFSEARLSSIDALYTEEAYLLCRRLEFKNLLTRFSVETKNEAAEHFALVESRAEAEKIFAKTGDRPLAFFFVEKQKKESGQMELFTEEAFSALAVTFSETDSYLFLTGEELTGSWLVERLLSCKGQLIAPDVKQALAFLPLGTACAAEDWEAYARMRGRFFDRTVAAYLINPLKSEYPYEDIAKDYLGMMVPSRADLLGKQSCAEALADKEGRRPALSAACYESYTAWAAAPVLAEELKKLGMYTLFTDIEMPLVFVLFDMEREGICMDSGALTEYGRQLSVSIGELEKKIYEQAGEEFNINSPKQLGVILFEKLALPNGKKTKTGFSTSAEVLEKLAGEYPIVSDILEYRQLAKLKSTYADGLVNYADGTGRIHTTFHQTITATGRLSSTDPNLQNIPIRIELGRLIRKVFHPMEGNLFVDSDYSQIELRLLAHMSGDENLISAFKNHQDIHRSTASLVFHMPFDEVTQLQRRNAKAVNFGIVYGISAFGLSQDLDISQKEAKAYIDSYFATYPKIKEFLDQSVEDAKKNGFTKTLYGRIRPIPELSSGNFMQRQFGERVAMNAPIQGTAADIIKLAMIRVHDRLLKEGFASRLILQVHDELLIETAESEKEAVIALLEEEMRGAADLSVELEIGTEFGYNWYDAH